MVVWWTFTPLPATELCNSFRVTVSITLSCFEGGSSLGSAWVAWCSLKFLAIDPAVLTGMSSLLDIILHGIPILKLRNYITLSLTYLECSSAFIFTPFLQNDSFFKDSSTEVVSVQNKSCFNISQVNANYKSVVSSLERDLSSEASGNLGNWIRIQAFFNFWFSLKYLRNNN